MSRTPIKTIPVGIVVQRKKAASQWVDYLWRPVQALPGTPDAAPWTKLSESGDVATFYAGTAEIGLFASDTGMYRDNLFSGSPALWVALRPTESDPPYELFSVTADSSEGEALMTAGEDIIDTVPMPDEIADVIGQFVTEHHVERVFYKRKRKAADPEALARRAPLDEKDRR